MPRRGRAGDLRRDDPRDLRRRVGPAPRGDRHAADRPRPAGHGLVAGRAAARRAAGRARAPRRRGSPRRRRLDVERRRPGRGCARWPQLVGDDPTRRQRLRAGPPVALARGHRLDLRRSGLPAVPALAAPDRGDLRDPRRDRRARVDQPGQAGLPRRLAGVAAAACPSREPLAPVAGHGPAPAGARAGRRGQADDEPRAGGDAVGRSRRGRGRRPAGRLADAAGHDAAGRAPRRASRVGAAGRRHRRGRDRPRPRLAGRRRGAGAPLPGPAADRGGPAGRGDRDRPARSGRGRRAAVGRGARRPRDERPSRDATSRRSSSSPIRRPARPSPRTGSRPRWPTRSPHARSRRLGDDRRLDAGRDLPARWSRRRCATRSRGPASTSGGATTATSRATTRCRTSRRSTTSCSGSAAARRARPAAAGRASRSRSTTSIRSRPARRSAGRAGPAWCAATLGRRAARGRPRRGRRLAGLRPRAARRSGRDGHLLSVFPGSAAFDSADLALAIPAPTHIEPHVERVTLNPAVIGVARDVLVVASRRGQGRRSSRGILGPERDPRRWPAQLARRAGRDLDPRRGGRRRRSPR